MRLAVFDMKILFQTTLPSCENFVLDLVKHQVLLVANEAYEVAKQRKYTLVLLRANFSLFRSSKIKIKDLFYVLRNQTEFLMRLVKYAKVRFFLAPVLDISCYRLHKRLRKSREMQEMRNQEKIKQKRKS